MNMTIDDFLQQFVEGYLFGDLESMSRITVLSGQTYGAAGYPMVATCLVRRSSGWARSLRACIRGGVR